MPEPQSFLITDLINDVKRGYIKIPQFQRDFIWSKEKAASLMDSILKGYPIGTMILWKTKETLRAITGPGVNGTWIFRVTCGTLVYKLTW